MKGGIKMVHPDFAYFYKARQCQQPLIKERVEDSRVQGFEGSRVEDYGAKGSRGQVKCLRIIRI